MQKTFFASKGRNFFTKTQLRRAHLRAARPAVAATAAQAAGRRTEKHTPGIGSRTAFRSGLAAAESRADRFACTGGTFSSHYAPPNRHIIMIVAGTLRTDLPDGDYPPRRQDLRSASAACPSGNADSSAGAPRPCRDRTAGAHRKHPKRAERVRRLRMDMRSDRVRELRF